MYMLTPKCTPLVFFAKFEKLVKVPCFHFATDFLENFGEDQPRNDELGNVIFICKCCVDQKI